VKNLNSSKGIPRLSFRPEILVCPICHRFLKRSHIQWRKQLLFSTGPKYTISWAYHCEDPDCPGSQQFFISQAAEGLHLRFRRISRELITRIGYRRFWMHQTMYELHDWLVQDLKITISEREILNLLGDFLALLRAGQAAKVRQKLSGLKYLIIGIDGMQPEKGNSCLYIAREMQTGLTLIAESLEDSATPFLVQRIFEPLKTLAKELNLNWQGVISDAQESLRLAVANSLPGVPHQVCQFHCLRDAGSLIFEQDRSLKTHLKSSIRGRLRRLEFSIQRLPDTDPCKDILNDYALSIHSTLLEGGIAPFDLAGIQIFDALSDIASSLERCQKKGAITFCAGC
jgi:hypothetical protein